MKKISKIKLNQFSKDELDRRKMNALKGGCLCARGCSCSSNCGVSGFSSVYNDMTGDSFWGSTGLYSY